MSVDVSQVRRAIIYCRVSTGKQEEEGSGLETQKKEGTAYCTSRGYNILEIVHEVHTGSELDERPQLTRIRRMMQSHQVDVVVVWKFDRLARNMAHQGVILYEAEKYGVSIESVKEDFDSTPEGHLLRTVIAFMAEKERETIRMRTLAGKQRRAERGEIIATAHALYGYDFNEDRTGYIICPEKAAVVHMIFELAAEGNNLREICRMLGRMHISSPWGAPNWSLPTTRKIIGNSAYWGKPTAMKYRAAKVDGVQRTTGSPMKYRRIFSVEGIPLSTETIPPIVSEELAKKAQAARGKPGGGNRRKHPMTLLEGFIWCGECEYRCRATFRCRTKYIDRVPFYVCGQGSGIPGSKCYTSRSAANLDKEVWQAIIVQLQHPERVLVLQPHLSG